MPGESRIGTPKKEVKEVGVSGRVSSSEKSMASAISAVKRTGAFFPARRDMLILGKEFKRGGWESRGFHQDAIVKSRNTVGRCSKAS